MGVNLHSDQLKYGGTSGIALSHLTLSLTITSTLLEVFLLSVH